MHNKKQLPFDEVFRLTKVLSRPKQLLATFGSSEIRYFFLAALNGRTTELREGAVVFQKPSIILPEEIETMFEGYGEDAAEFVRELYGGMRRELRILGYHYKHQPQSGKTVADSFSQVLRRIRERTKDEYRTAIISGIAQRYELSVLKFTIETILMSLPANMTEFEERGFFQPPSERALTQQRAKIEHLFKLAAHDRTQVPLLAETLKRTNLFSLYEDRFFELVNRSTV